MFKDHSAAAMRRGSAFVLCIGLAIVPSVAEAALRGKARADFLRADFRRCVGNSHKHPVVRDLDPEILRRNCSCAGNYAADRISGADYAIVVFGSHGERQQAFRRAQALSHEGWRACIRESRVPGL